MTNFVTAETFTTIAKKKGVHITWQAHNQQDHDKRQIHLDMNMINASLQLAIQNCVNTSIKEKLLRLQNNGTDVQKVEFVMGTGTYHFPEDIEMLVKHFNDDDNGTCQNICEIIAYTVCRCVELGDQVCQEVSRNICHVVCD
jgi:hypothetical protein